ncbi:MAG: hypothetical protein P8P98_02625, partial [Emcibacteraceae bacterium]|nr:hypothetical protein [Emcibacteraceae bacterium]
NIITSSKTQKVLVKGQSISIEIYKLEGTGGWTLEVINDQGTSIVWEDLFGSDEDALSTALDTLDEEGLAIFTDNDAPSNDNVIQFNRDS